VAEVMQALDRQERQEEAAVEETFAHDVERQV
jgi:hypothetical protein